MKNKSFPYNDEINISDIIRRLYKEKFLILFFTIIFGIIFSLLPNFSESKKNKIIFVLKDKTDLFQEYTIYLGFNYDTENNFNNQFQSELLKFENMNDFLKRDKDFEKFQKYFKQINTTSRKYFMETFGQATHQNKNIYNQFFFFQSDVYTPTFFKNYIHFIKEKSFFQNKKFIQINLQNKLDRIDGILKTLDTSVGYEYTISEKKFLLVKYNSEIIELERLLKKLENLKMDDDIISYMDDTVPLSTSPELLKLNLHLGLIIGFFISLTIIFFKRNF
jgi:hypothetical protein